MLKKTLRSQHESPRCETFSSKLPFRRTIYFQIFLVAFRKISHLTIGQSWNAHREELIAIKDRKTKCFIQTYATVSQIQRPRKSLQGSVVKGTIASNTPAGIKSWHHDRTSDRLPRMYPDHNSTLTINLAKRRFIFMHGLAGNPYQWFSLHLQASWRQIDSFYPDHFKMKHLKDPTRGEGKQIFSTMPELNAKHYVGHEFIEISEASWISPATSIVVIVAIIISRPAEAELTATRREHDCASIDDVKRERERYQEEEVTRSSRVSAADGIRNYPPSRHRKYRWRNGSLIPRPASCQYLSSTSFIFLLLFLSIRLSLSWPVLSSSVVLRCARVVPRRVGWLYRPRRRLGQSQRNRAPLRHVSIFRKRSKRGRKRKRETEGTRIEDSIYRDFRANTDVYRQSYT